MSNNSNSGLKPVACAVSQWNSSREILYQCPRCKTDFRIFGTNEKYCHTCSQKIDWSVIVVGTKKLAELYFGENDCQDIRKQQRIMGEINYLNNRIPSNTGIRALLDEYKFDCENDLKIPISESEKVLGSTTIISPDDDLPFCCKDCHNKECAYMGKKVSIFCEHFSAT